MKHFLRLAANTRTSFAGNLNIFKKPLASNYNLNSALNSFRSFSSKKEFTENSISSLLQSAKLKYEKIEPKIDKFKANELYWTLQHYKISYKITKLYKEILDLQELVTIAHNNFGKENTLKDLYKNLEKKTDNMKNLLVKNASASQEIFFILNNKKLAPDVEEIKKDKETEWMKVICNYNLAASKFAFIKDSYKALNETLDNPFDSFVKSTSLVACTLNSLKPANEDFIDKVKKFDISLAKLEEFLSLKNCEKEILSKNSACFDETHISSHNEAGKMKDDNVGYSDYIGGIFFASLALSSIIMGAVEDQYLDSEE